MKIRFKHQAYQQNAVDAVVECFTRQPRREGIEYRVDPGRKKMTKGQQALALDPEEEAGFRNHELLISEGELLQNIREVQRNQNLPLSQTLYEFKTIKNNEFVV